MCPLVAAQHKSDADDDSARVLSLEQAWDQAENTHDAQAMSMLLAETFELINDDGISMSKSQWLAHIKSEINQYEHMGSGLLASERFLQLMLTRGIFLPRDDYRDIVIPAMEWAFEKVFVVRLGKVALRDAIEMAAFTARGDAHQVLMGEFTKLLGRVRLEDKEDWFLHAVREVIAALMANPACIESSPELKQAFRAVNKIQRSHTALAS
jgi:hypothetical protein